MTRHLYESGRDWNSSPACRAFHEWRTIRRGRHIPTMASSRSGILWARLTVLNESLRPQLEDSNGFAWVAHLTTIYAACPEPRVVQDYTSDPDRLAASLNSFVP